MREGFRSFVRAEASSRQKGLRIAVPLAVKAKQIPLVSACIASHRRRRLFWLLQEELYIKFAEFEERCKETERARAIFRYALDHIPRAQASEVYQAFVQFEKQNGDREGIEVRPNRLM